MATVAVQRDKKADRMSFKCGTFSTKQSQWQQVNQMHFTSKRCVDINSHTFFSFSEGKNSVNFMEILQIPSMKKKANWISLFLCELKNALFNTIFCISFAQSKFKHTQFVLFDPKSRARYYLKSELPPTCHCTASNIDRCTFNFDFIWN